MPSTLIGTRRKWKEMDASANKEQYIKPFHEWKSELRAKEAPLVRDRYWYYEQYGRYCNKMRALNHAASLIKPDA